MMTFKNDDHRELYLSLMRVLENDDKDYRSFAYTVSAIGKYELMKAVGKRRVHHDALQKMSAPWSNSERSMIELGYWLFSGRNFYENRDGEHLFTTITDVFSSLDSENRQVALSAMNEHFSR